MSQQTISDDLALRLGLAAKALPQISVQQFVNGLLAELGSPLSQRKLRSMSPKTLYASLRQIDSDLERAQANHAYAVLTSDEISAMQAPQVPEAPNLTGPKVKVAISSNNEEMLDGHFGSCLRFLVYEVNADTWRLSEVRPVESNANGSARTDYLLDLLRDCHFLATLSIGGPAAAKVTRADIHPIKQALPINSHEIVERIHQAIAGNPPPWLKKILQKQEVSE